MINALADSLLQIMCILPLLVFAGMRQKRGGNHFLIAAALVFIATSVATDVFSGTSMVNGQQWNWVGKMAALLIALLFIFLYRPLPPHQFGLTTKIVTNGARYIFFICAAYALLRLVLHLSLADAPGVLHGETILFQSTMPGIVEEIIFRGILLALLNQVFTTPRWKLVNVSFGWAAIITSVLFGCVHGIGFDSDYHIHFNAFAIARAAFEGFLFALLTEKTKSIIPGMLFHNLLNLISNH